MSHILIIDDEPNMQLGLKDNLEFEGYTVAVASDGQAGLTQARQGHFDLILLDVMMPHLSGFEVCRTLRKEGNQTPVIFLTAKGEELDKVRGLELGGDDYLTKPFSLRELLARVKAILRRQATTAPKPVAPSEVTLGRLTVNFERYEAQCDGAAVKMSHKEFEVLHYLWQQRNQVVDRYELLEKVWGYDAQPTTRTVDNFVMRLRHKIETEPDTPHLILTVHGVGYKLLADR
jgi:DNA-binding response OmpR family regulator